MDNQGLPKTAIEALRTVEFKISLRGYGVEEVDDYLEKVAVEADALQEQLRQMTDRLRQAAERIAQLDANKSSGAPEPAVQAAPVVAAIAEVDAAKNVDSLTRTLELAQRFVDETKRESEEEAAKTIAAARMESQRLQAEAEGRYKADLSRLEGLKSKMTSDVESMARQLESERTRLRSSLSEMIQWIEDNVQPGAAIMALRQGDGASDALSSPQAEASIERPSFGSPQAGSPS